MTGARLLVRDKKNGSPPQCRVKVWEIKPESPCDEPNEATNGPSEAPIGDRVAAYGWFVTVCYERSRYHRRSPATKTSASLLNWASRPSLMVTIHVNWSVFSAMGCPWWSEYTISDR